MANVVSTVNGYAIHVEAKQEGRWMVYSYWTEVEPKKYRTWKTLGGAIKWCEKH